MRDPRLKEILGLLDPKPGTRLWYGGATPLGCLRGVTAKQAAWRPSPDRHSIWELTLHVAYWKYAVRRILEGSPKGGFARSPSNWPQMPEVRSENAWKQDRALLRTEHEQLVGVIRDFNPRQLDSKAPGSGTYRFADLLFGVATHDIYHTGQIQMLKRLYADV